MGDRAPKQRLWSTGQSLEPYRPPPRRYTTEIRSSTRSSGGQIPSEPYTYRPFDEAGQEIRLIRILPEKTGHVRCSLTTFNLEALPEYICLSYTWGPPTPTRKIAVDNGFVIVRENLHNFLQECDVEEYMWIDQISIDQSDIQERSHQVLLMAQIYRRSLYIVVWLGNEETYIQAILGLRDGDKRYRNTREMHWGVITRHVYFTRLWIVQEILLASEVWLLTHGSVWISWNSLKDLRWMGHPNSLSERILPDHDKIPQARRLLQIEPADLVTNHLGWYIIDFCGNHCQNPLDKVYGLLGLVGDQMQITPDYTKSVNEVYVDVVRAMCISFLDGKTTPDLLFGSSMEFLRQQWGIEGITTSMMDALYADILDLIKVRGITDIEIDVGFESEYDQRARAMPESEAKDPIKNRWWLQVDEHTRYYY